MITAPDKCRKPGCGASRIPGHPCSDGDCPQQWVHHLEHREIIKAFGARGSEFDWHAEPASSGSTSAPQSPSTDPGGRNV